MQLDIVVKFQNADLEFDVATVFDSEVEASRSKVALLGVNRRPTLTLSLLKSPQG